MDGIQGNKAVTLKKRNVDDDEVVNMVQIFTNLLFRNLWEAVTDDDVASRSGIYFTSYVPWQEKLTVAPRPLDLPAISSGPETDNVVDLPASL